MENKSIERLNLLSEEEALESFMRCCGCSRWAREMVKQRPFMDALQLTQTAETVWETMGEADWREAFEHHPKIGDVDNLRRKFASTAAWAENEQASISSADEATIESLAKGNADYQKKFGFIFIVCATGKTADEMLYLLQNRINNDPADEIRIAAGEQAQIMKVRLEKLCQEVLSQPTS